MGKLVFATACRNRAWLLVVAGLVLDAHPLSGQVRQAWVTRYAGAAGLDDVATAMAVDTTGNVYVTGYSYRGAGANSYDYVTIKYGPSGNQLWLVNYDGPVGGDDRPSG